MSFSLRLTLAAVATTAAAVALGVVIAGEPEAPPPETPQSTPLTELDTSQVLVVRQPFCERVAPDAVEEALGAAAEGSTTWADGDPVPVARGQRDVGQEHGCRWTGAAGEVAAAWLFAPPVTREQADGLVEKASAEKRCEPAPAAAAFGSPTVATVCSSGQTSRTTYRGLFGDAWLTCTLTLPSTLDRATLLDRTGRWCVAVAEATTAATS